VVVSGNGVVKNNTQAAGYNKCLTRFKITEVGHFFVVDVFISNALASKQ
jgi:hypothetical protein